MAVNRQQVKWEMRFDRGGNGALCDLGCGEVATQMHEIINRGRTIGNEAAREASYDKHICSLLCPSCHTLNNLAETNDQTLLAFNVDMYGYEAVYAALTAVNNLLYLPLDVDIPKDES